MLCALSLRRVRLTLYGLSLLMLGVSVSNMGEEVGSVPSFAHHGFLTHSAHWSVLLTRDWHTFLVSRETKLHPHRALGILLDQGSSS